MFDCAVSRPNVTDGCPSRWLATPPVKARLLRIAADPYSYWTMALNM
ncbi:MAG: hypothetical protein ABI114_09855 [Rhodanobacter sp.]